MNEMHLHDDDSIVRYVKPTAIREDGTVDGSEFRLRPHRPDDQGVSVNWLECFEGLDKQKQIREVRRLRRLEWKRRGKLAEMTVGRVREHVRAEPNTVHVVQVPLDACERFEADPSHSEIRGLPPGGSDQAALVGDLIAECVNALHPAVED